MQKNYDRIEAHNAIVIAVSKDNVQTTNWTIQKENIQFPVLSDVDLKVIIPYNVENQLNRGIARPATFLLESDGTIVWKSIDTAFERVPTGQIIRELAKLW